MKQKGKLTRKKLKKQVYRALDLPEEADRSVLKLTMVGRGDLLVENHTGVLTCTERLLRLNSALGAVTIVGEELSMAEFSEDRAFIRGTFTSLAFEDAF